MCPGGRTLRLDTNPMQGGRPVRDRQRINEMKYPAKNRSTKNAEIIPIFFNKLRSRGKRKYVRKIYKNKIDSLNGFQI